MSSADPEEVSVEITREGVSVEKSFEPDDFPVPAIAFVIRSERDVPVEVKLVDTVPDDIQAEDIGFHPKYGAEHWRNEGDELIFERTFEAGEEYTTVYGLRARDTDDVGRFLGEPELAEVDPPKDSSDVVRDVIGEGSDPGTSDDDLEAAIAAADVEDTPEEPSASQSGTASTPSVAPESVAPESIASMLAESIRAGQVSDSDMEVLRDALGNGGGGSNSLEVRIDHLQSEVADLKAYSDALEEFIDENGEARTMVRELRETIEGLEGDVSEVESSMESVSGEVSEATDRIDDIGEDVSRIDEDVSRIDEEVDRVGTDVEEVGSEVADVEESLSSVEERMDELDGSISDVDEELSAVHEEIDDVRGEVDGVRDEIPEGRIDAIDERMNDLQDELEELAEMRKRMASVFGGGMGGGSAEADDGEAADSESDADADADDEDEEE